MMAYKNILFEVKDRIAYVTINRPQVLNALNIETVEELSKVFSAIEEDEKVASVILTGAGEKAFVAGADIGELVKLDALGGRDFSLNGQRVFNQIENLSKPVIAAVNGFALGGGCELALACTLRVAAETARFGQPEINLGIIPGYGGTQRLARLVGKGRALEMVLTGNMVSAEEAYRIGLVNKVAPLSELLNEAKKLAEVIMSKGPIAVRLAMVAINQGLQMSLQQGLQMEASLFGLTCATEDMKEGTSAFLEKRKPAFKGR
ncbi:enoyl-CoA hydratase [bacterium (candidate division B38) B3_B38]|nr:MAG: enoyl-CoA hydratase [bacterium (candidate division B38) B3_B38]